jgi:uncharacterized protein YacL
MEILFIAIGLIINGIISNIIGKLGEQKRIGYNTAFWSSFLLSPILGILFVIASTTLNDTEKEEIRNTKEKNKNEYKGEKYLYSKKDDIIVICFIIFVIILLISYRHLI